MANLSIRLKPGRERSVLQRHPWLFSGAIAALDGSPGMGETVDLLDARGQWLARGAFSPDSQIRVRLWTWDHAESIDEAFFARRLDQSIRRRRPLLASGETNACREVHAESDGLPGVIVDRYASFRAVQLLSAGSERWRPAIVEALAARGDVDGIYERSDVSVRELEGLPPRTGRLWGEEPPHLVEIREDGVRYHVDIRTGQKTGFYLDQREHRQLLRRGLGEAEVLNAFAYTGGFTVAALEGGARSVLSIDSSAEALDVARANVVLNGLSAEACQWTVADAFTELRRLRDRAARFDVIVLDPPRFAATAAQADRAARGYKDINLLAFKLLRPGGRLFTFSCSGGISPELFEKIVAGAALDAQVQVAILQWLGQPADHPVVLSFPEGRYLKGLVCQRLV